MLKSKQAAELGTEPASRVEIPLLTVSSSPHIKHPDNARTLMADVLIALTPAFVWGIYIFGWRALTLGLISLISCVLIEAATQRILHRPVAVGDLSAAVTGLLLAMNMPVSAPLWLPVVGAAFAIVIVKQLYGGIGKNVVNPALAARVFLFISFPGFMSTFTEPHTELSPFAITLNSYDAVATATPLASLKNGVMPDQSVFTLLIGDHAGTIGEVSALLLIAGGIYLVVRRVISWRIPVAYLGTVGLLTVIFPKLALASDLVALGFAGRELVTGGLMLGAIYMATDYATSPVTPAGRIIYGVGCGALTVFMRYFGQYSEGVSFAILIMNLMVWYLDKFSKPKYFGWTKPDKPAKTAEGGVAGK